MNFGAIFHDECHDYLNIVEPSLGDDLEIKIRVGKDKGKKDKEKRVLTLGSIDQKILNELFNELYDKKDILEFIIWSIYNKK